MKKLRKGHPYDRYLIPLTILMAFLGCEHQEKKQGDSVAPANWYVTTLDQKQLMQPHSVGMDPNAEPTVNIRLDSSTTYQEMDGFGYTLTGGSAMLLQGMSTARRAELLEELFGNGPNTISVSYLRLSVGASDLDEKTWSYDDMPKGATDLGLVHFSLGYDTLYLIPTLKEILKISPNIKLMGSPWSPPAWMKDNEDTRGGSLKKEYYGVYANYLANYVEAMAGEGIAIDALTIQNEPLHPGNNPSMLMLADAQADFIKNHLGPKFKAMGIKTKIVIYDHNADRPDYPISILDDPQAEPFIDGSAFHLYGGTIGALSQVHDAHPSKNIYFTEQWIGAPGDFANDFSWHIEQLMIGAPRNWSKTVLQWNLAADENQEPHTDRGGCDRCLGALTIKGEQVTRNPAYYIVAQFSKFVPPGSLRIASTAVDQFPNVAFLTPKGKVVVAIQNNGGKDETIKVVIGKRSFVLPLSAGAVGTLVL